MRFFYSIGIRFYTMLVRLASIRNAKAKLWISGRQNWAAQLTKIPDGVKPVWVHCSSLGEFEQGRPLIESIKKKFPDQFILLTFYSPSGFEVRKNYDNADLIMYLPTDTLANAKKFIKSINPAIAIFIKYEFWFNFIYVLHKNHIPLYSVSTIFREDQLFFKSTGKWFRKHLRYFSWFFVQNELSQKLLHSIGVTETSVCGDTRYDRVYAIAKEAKSIDEIDAFSKSGFTIVAGSTWPAEDEMLVKLANQNSGIKLVVAPHELHEKTYAYYENEVDGKVVRLSKTTIEEAALAKVLLVDSIGLLSSIYRYGKVAVVGGGFGKGIHNILEPAVYGMPVIIGPNFEKFYEAVTMHNLELIHVVTDLQELQKVVNNYTNNNDYLARKVEKITAFVEHQLGATEVVLQGIENKLVNA